MQQSSHEYIRVVNTLVAEMAEEKKRLKKTTKDVPGNLPSAVKNQAIKDANSVFSTKVKKSKYAIIPILKKPICVWNNQNYSFDFKHISIPFLVEGKSKRVKICALFIGRDHRNADLLKHKLGTLRVTKSSGKWVAQIAVTMPTTEKTGVRILGVDLGLKVPAVAITDDDQVRFLGMDEKTNTRNGSFVVLVKSWENKRK